MLQSGIMPRNRYSDIGNQIPIWTCPHCGHRHTPATLRHASGSGHNHECQNPACKKLFNVKAVYVWKKDVPELL